MSEKKSGPKISSAVNSSSPVNALVGVIYDLEHLPLVENLFQQEITLEETFLLFADSPRTESRAAQTETAARSFYLALQAAANDRIGVASSEVQRIRQVVGLCDQIIGIELPSEVESVIEKVFLEMLSDTCEQAIQPLGKATLNLLNSGYRKTYSRVNEGIYYFKRTEDFIQNSIILPFLKRHEDSDESPKRPQTPLKKCRVSFEESNRDSALLTVKELLSVLDHCKESQKETYKIKHAWLRFRALDKSRQKMRKGESIIFTGFETHKEAEITTQIRDLNLPRHELEKMEWKQRQIHRYRELLRQFHHNTEIVRVYKVSPIYELPNEAIKVEIGHFHRQWTSNTLRKLKESFYKIANRRDTKAVNEFREKCERTLKKIGECQESRDIEDFQRVYLEQMREEIADFIEYHQQIIKGSFFSSLKYMRKEIGYYWRNNPKIFYRIALFLLVAYFASLQDNIIFAFSILSVGLIFSAINI